MNRASRGFFSLSWIVAALAALGAGGWVGAAESGHDFEVVDSDLVYLGKATHPKAPSTIRADDVWAAIPEYRKILDNDLGEDDPEYHLLMKKASERFAKALEREAKREGFDLIAEVGAVISGTGLTIPDATQDMIDLVTRN
ncbi:MAG: hypothetical protein ACT4PV_00215 [Planctomycetaceae bacterium]